jgi:hypothetical protein
LDSSEVALLVIAILVMAIILGLYLTLSGKGAGLIEFLKNLLRFGR